MVKLVVFTFLVFLHRESYCAIRGVSSINLKISKEKGELDSLRRNLKKLKSDILSLKSNVGGETQKFSKIISIKSNLKNEIDRQELLLVRESKQLEKEIEVLNKIFAGMILTDGSDDEIDYRFVTIKKLKEKEKALVEKKRLIESLSNSIKKMKKEVSEYDFLEAELISNIEQMHSSEKDLQGMASKLEGDIGVGEKNLKKLKRLKKKLLKKQRMASKAKEIKKNKVEAVVPKKMKPNVVRQFSGSLSFALPLNKFEKIQKDKNGGLNLFVKSDREILAPEKGFVMYTGKLSTYGNVVVIKHDGDYQSIILGDIISSVSKNQSVKKGDVIGKIIENSGDYKKVYYELRNKNKKVSYDKFLNQVKL